MGVVLVTGGPCQDQGVRSRTERPVVRSARSAPTEEECRVVGVRGQREEAFGTRRPTCRAGGRRRPRARGNGNSGRPILRPSKVCDRRLCTAPA